MGEYYKVHCPRCGRTMTADQLAFDFGKIINDDLQYQKNRELARKDDWIDITKFNLCLYLTLDDLKKEPYNFKETPERTYKGRFIFRPEDLARQIIKLTMTHRTDLSIEDLTKSYDMIEFDTLTDFMALKSGQDKVALAQEIQNLCALILRNKNDIIAEFNVEVLFAEDDRGNRFANRLSVQFNNRKYKDYTKFVCAGDSENPCGKVLYGQAGCHAEVVIGLAGTARVGKTAYLAALLASLARKGDQVERLGHDQRAIVNIAFSDKSYDEFQKDLIEPYLLGKKIKKTENITEGSNGDRETIPLFSLTFCINNRNYIFTFVDMPGEVYDDSEGESQNLITNNRRIIQAANMIWLCIAPAQIDPAVGNFNSAQVNVEIDKAFSNIKNTMSAIHRNGRIPTAVLVTRSDEGANHGIYDAKFNPFPSPEHPFAELGAKNEQTPWVKINGAGNACALYYNNMKWHLDRAARYLSLTPGLPKTISDIFGMYTPFAVAAYGREIDDLIIDDNQSTRLSNLPTPSMIEGPFLWTLAVLGIIPVFTETPVEKERSKMVFFKEKYTEIENVRLDRAELTKIFYSK